MMRVTSARKAFPAIRITRIALAAALVCVASFVRFPLGFVPVMFTAQVYMVLTVGLLLGAKDGALAIVVYLLIGLAGVPVFTRGGGFGALASPEGGYLCGFVASAFAAGLAGDPRRAGGSRRDYIAAIAGIAACYAVALPYIAALQAVLGNPVEAGRLFAAYCLAFIPMDIIKGVMAALTARGLRRAAPGLFAR
ncbi:MAG: biotin transporter BioY [Oscillospiraceae bacterium]|jgi:biotin transport system substrate-specific component|nr:biotin transporter BioY [Oscillospiraceae bacterium]